MEIEQVVEKALSKFLHFGIRSVSMDDISSLLGISKKTLYKFVDDKDDLVYKCMHHFIQFETVCCSMILNDKVSNPIERLVNLSKHHSKSMKGINPATLYDIHKYHPKSWRLLLEYKKNIINKSVHENIVIGQKGGWYRKELDVDLASKFYMVLVDAIMNPQLPLLENHGFKELTETLIDYHLHAVVSMKGREYLLEIEK